MPDDKDRAQAELAKCGIEPGQVYHHYKGGVYSIVCTSINENTIEPLVTYHSNAKDINWTRTLKDFTEWVVPPGELTRRRFVREEK